MYHDAINTLYVVRENRAFAGESARRNAKSEEGEVIRLIFQRN